MHLAYRRSLRSLISLGLILGLFGLWWSPPVRAQTSQVMIMNFAFQPETITVPAGTTVSWMNMDTAPHTATSDTGAWDTGTISTNQTRSITFNQAGTFPYHCAIHPQMHGTVVVQQAQPTTAPPPPPPPAAAATATPTATAVPPTPTSVPTKAPSTSTRTKQILAKEVKEKYVFSPVKTTIKVGTRVSWVNKTDAPHTVTSRTRGWKYDKKLGVGKKLALTFRKTGTFKYYCKYHAGMVGTIVVKR